MLRKYPKKLFRNKIKNVVTGLVYPNIKRITKKVRVRNFAFKLITFVIKTKSYIDGIKR